MDLFLEGSRLAQDTIRAMISGVSRQGHEDHWIGSITAFGHRTTDVLEALVVAHESDKDPTVRKMAGWWIPGDVRYT